MTKFQGIYLSKAFLDFEADVKERAYGIEGGKKNPLDLGTINLLKKKIREKYSACKSLVKKKEENHRTWHRGRYKHRMFKENELNSIKQCADIKKDKDRHMTIRCDLKGEY